MQCNRLRTFHASFLAAEFFEPLTRMVSGYLVELEDLDLDVDLGELRMPGKIPGALETAPLLHSVKLCNKSSFWGPYLRLPWTQLTVLVLKNISLPANTPHILTKCINLEDCTPVVRGWKDNDCPALGIPVAGSIQLLALHTLNLDLSQCHQTSLFFHPLTLPLLSDLTLGYSSRDYIYIHSSRSKNSNYGLALKFDGCVLTELFEAVPNSCKLWRSCRRSPTWKSSHGSLTIT